jgi:hypothetical protein
LQHAASSFVLRKTQAVCPGKGKGLPRTGHEGPEREKRDSSTLSSTSALDGGGCCPCKKDKVKLRIGGVEVQFSSLLTSALGRGERST